MRKGVVNSDRIYGPNQGVEGSAKLRNRRITGGFFVIE